jgi:hypothetical protein
MKLSQIRGRIELCMREIVLRLHFFFVLKLWKRHLTFPSFTTLDARKWWTTTTILTHQFGMLELVRHTISFIHIFVLLHMTHYVQQWYCVKRIGCYGTLCHIDTLCRTRCGLDKNQQWQICGNTCVLCTFNADNKCTYDENMHWNLSLSLSCCLYLSFLTIPHFLPPPPSLSSDFSSFLVRVSWLLNLEIPTFQSSW